VLPEFWQLPTSGQCIAAKSFCDQQDVWKRFHLATHSIARYEERDGRVYLELQAIALTRDIPASLRWLDVCSGRAWSLSEIENKTGHKCS
jgi:hypothetical protein